MTPEEKLENKAWEILQKIKTEILFNDTLSILWKTQQKSYQNSFSFEFIFEKGEKVVLNTLERKGALKINVESPMKHSSRFSATAIGLPEIVFDNNNVLYLDIIQPKFDEVYKEYEKKLINKINIQKDTDETINSIHKHLLEDKKRKMAKKMVVEQKQSKIIEFKQPFAPTFDGKKISMPSIEKLSTTKVSENIEKLEDEDKKRLTDRIEEILKNKSLINKEYKIDEFYDYCDHSMLGNSDRCFYRLEKVIITNISEIIKKTEFEVLFALEAV